MSSDKINTIQNWPKIKKNQGYTSILKICKFLLLIYLQLLKHGYSADLVDMEEYLLKL